MLPAGTVLKCISICKQPTQAQQMHKCYEFNGVCARTTDITAGHVTGQVHMSFLIL